MTSEAPEVNLSSFMQQRWKLRASKVLFNQATTIFQKSGRDGKGLNSVRKLVLECDGGIKEGSREGGDPSFLTLPLSLGLSSVQTRVHINPSPDIPYLAGRTQDIRWYLGRKPLYACGSRDRGAFQGNGRATEPLQGNSPC